MKQLRAAVVASRALPPQHGILQRRHLEVAVNRAHPSYPSLRASRARAWLCAAAATVMVAGTGPVSAAESSPGHSVDGCLYNDSHFHLTNYVQKGTDMRKYVDEIMGDKVCRSTVFGIPLQQTWSYENSGDFAPTYYLQSDAPLYYYSFTDAWIATQSLKLKPEQRTRLDPMITGFNPADMYAVDHIRRVLEAFPGVFSGIGEFSIHKEFVSSKVAGEIASLTNPALDRMLDFAGETGLAVILHSDIDMPFAKAGAEPVFLKQMKDLLRRHPRDDNHLGPHGSRPRRAPRAEPGDERRGGAQPQSDRSRRGDDRRTRRSATSISTSPGTRWRSTRSRRPSPSRETAALLDKYPDRFLFGTDNVAPADQATQLRVYDLWAPIWAQHDAGGEP